MGFYVALVHYPVLDKQGQSVATSITNLDIHDIARSSRTYGIEKFFVVNPIPGQQWFAHRVIEHWLEGFGAEYNWTRKEAMQITKVVGDLEEVADDILCDADLPIVFIATTARKMPQQISFELLRKKFGQEPAHYCIVFGTGWGLHPSLLMDIDYTLEPIVGVGDYNHLSVRAASAIILDRLFSPHFDPDRHSI
jgi:hypothetical protein